MVPTRRRALSGAGVHAPGPRSRTSEEAMRQDRNRIHRFVYALVILMFVAVPLVAASCGGGSSKSKAPTTTSSATGSQSRGSNSGGGRSSGATTTKATTTTKKKPVITRPNTSVLPPKAPAVRGKSNEQTGIIHR